NVRHSPADADVVNSHQPPAYYDVVGIPLVELFLSFFFFNDPATTEIYTLSLHDALPICRNRRPPLPRVRPVKAGQYTARRRLSRSEEHTSELQSRENLVCRLLLEKKKKVE